MYLTDGVWSARNWTSMSACANWTILTSDVGIFKFDVYVVRMSFNLRNGAKEYEENLLIEMIASSLILPIMMWELLVVCESFNEGKSTSCCWCRVERGDPTRD